jgi:uncharacterized membrane protein YfcA
LVNIVGLASLAMIAGIASGMMTMGGGLIQVSGMMLIFGYGMIIVRPVVYLTNIFVFAASALRSRKIGLLKWKNVSDIVPWIIIGVLFGYFLGNKLGDTQLSFIIGIIALVLVFKTLFEIFEYKQNKENKNADQQGKDIKQNLSEEDDLLANIDEFEITKGKIKNTADWLTWIKNKSIKTSFVGIPVGIACGMLGITGGVLAVPLQQHIYGASLHRSIVNSTVFGFFASLTGLTVALTHGITTGILSWQTILGISIIMIPGAYVGGLIGARLLHAVSVNILRWVYVLIMLLVAGKMIL